MVTQFQAIGALVFLVLPLLAYGISALASRYTNFDTQTLSKVALCYLLSACIVVGLIMKLFYGEKFKGDEATALYFLSSVGILIVAGTSRKLPWRPIFVAEAISGLGAAVIWLALSEGNSSNLLSKRGSLVIIAMSAAPLAMILERC